jgi:hypothetical protein
MERCYLRALIPQYNEKESIGSGSVIDVWLLEASGEISQEIYQSSTSAPNRRLLLTSLVLSESLDASYEFDCPSKEFTTLEFSCPFPSDVYCHVDFWQDKRRTPTAGLSSSLSCIDISHLV